MVSEEAQAQLGRLKYLLSHGLKEGLVARPQDWPGSHCVRALVRGDPVRGRWFDRTREFAARRRGEACPAQHFSKSMTFELKPLPCWDSETDPAYRDWIRDLLREIAGEHPAPQRLARLHLLPVDERPVETKKTPAPWFHCSSRATRMRPRTAYARFYLAFRDAAERLREGDLTASFPEGCFPPPRPFVLA